MKTGQTLQREGSDGITPQFMCKDMYIKRAKNRISKPKGFGPGDLQMLCFLLPAWGCTDSLLEDTEVYNNHSLL